MTSKDNSSWMGWQYHKDLLPTQVSCHTRLILEECVFRWTIENFNFLIMGEMPGFSVKSPNFPNDSSKTYKWNVEFFPLGLKEDNDVLSVNLHLVSVPLINAKTVCVIIFRDSYMNELMKTTLTGVYTAGCSGQLLSLKILPNSQLQAFLRNNSVINIETKISCTLKNSEELLEIKECKKEIFMHELLDDLSKLYLQKILSDVIIKVKETNFYVHQVILAARSPVFAAMLENDMKEKHEKIIKLENVEPEHMKKVLQFLYTSDIEYTSVTDAWQILIIANRYAVENLQKLAEDYLIFHLNVDNILCILNVADLHNAKVLKSKAIEFICKNSSSFKSFEKYSMANINNMVLFIEIMMAMASISK